MAKKVTKSKSATKKIEERFICGQSEGVIRKAYFGNNLPALLNQIQAEGKFNEGEIEQLGVYLEGLRTENDEMVNQLLTVFGGKIVDNGEPPTVEELTAGADDKKWREKADQAITFIETTMDTIRRGIAEGKKFANDYWFNTFQSFISMEDLVIKDVVYKEQLYKAEIMRIMDKHGVSRKEAEDRAQITKFYFDYKTLSKLPDRLKEQYTFLRRKDDETNHR